MKRFIRFLKQLISRIKQERQAKKDFETWEKRVKRADQLNPKDRAIWYEEEEKKWKSWYGE